MLKKNKNNAGLSIPEVLVSILLLSITMIAGMSFYMNANKVSSLAFHKKSALELATKELERLKGNGYNSLPAAGTPVLSAVKVGTLSNDGTVTEITGLQTVNVTNHSGYKQVDVSISWSEVDQTDLKTVSLTTFMSP